AVLPFDGERSPVADVVERDDERLEVDHAAAHAAEVPRAPRVAEAGVATEGADRAVALAPPDVLHVGVEDAAAEAADERDVVDALVAEVARVEVEAEAAVLLHGLERAFGGIRVEGDLGGMHLEREVHVVLVEHGEDGLEAAREVGETGVPVRLSR